MTDIVHVPDPRQAPALRWGIIGPGGIAHRFAREVAQYTASTIHAVGSRSAERARSFAAEFGIERAYGSYADLVADPEVDAVYVSSPHSEHHDHALLALNAGKPVLVEKAFAINAGQAQEVFATAEAKGLFAMEAMWSRFLPHYQTLRALVAAGALGDVVSAYAVHCQSLDMDPAGRLMNASLAGGALLDLGVYPISFFHFLCGVPQEVYATGVRTDTGVDRRETVVLRYAALDATGIHDMAAQGLCNACVVGTKARVEIGDWFFTPNDLTLRPLAAGSEAEVLPTGVEGGFQYEAAEAARRIAGGELESPIMSWQDTIDVMRTMDEGRRQLGVRFPQE